MNENTNTSHVAPSQGLEDENAMLKSSAHPSHRHSTNRKSMNE